MFFSWSSKTQKRGKKRLECYSVVCQELREGGGWGQEMWRMGGGGGGGGFQTWFSRDTNGCLTHTELTPKWYCSNLKRQLFNYKHIITCTCNVHILIALVINKFYLFYGLIDFYYTYWGQFCFFSFICQCTNTWHKKAISDDLTLLTTELWTTVTISTWSARDVHWTSRVTVAFFAAIGIVTCQPKIPIL